MINNWKKKKADRPDRPRPTGKGAQKNQLIVRLSFHPSYFRAPFAAINFQAVDPSAPREGLSAADSVTFARARFTEDLGSLDPLDPTEDQTLYDELYRPDASIFWVSEGEGDLVQVYYLWARVEHLRQLQMNPLAHLGSSCLLFSRISTMADLAC